MASKNQTLRIEAKQYEDHDDSLSAAAADVARERGLEAWDLSPRWEDDDRAVILVDVPHGIDYITHDGRLYLLSDLAYYLDDEHREDLHAEGIEDPQAWWDEYRRRWPVDARHAVECAPTASSRPRL